MKYGVIVLLCLLSIPAYGETFSDSIYLQDDIWDNTICSPDSTTNYFDSTRLYLTRYTRDDIDKRVLIYFDIAGEGIPSNAEIDTAYFRLEFGNTSTGGDNNDKFIYWADLNKAATERYSCWDSATTRLAWATPGAGGISDRTILDSMAIDSGEVVTAGIKYFDCTAWLQAVVDGDSTNHGFWVSWSDGTDTCIMSIYSEDATGKDAAKRPRLYYTYSLNKTDTIQYGGTSGLTHNVYLPTRQAATTKDEAMIRVSNDSLPKDQEVGLLKFTQIRQAIDTTFDVTNVSLRLTASYPRSAAYVNEWADSMLVQLFAVREQWRCGDSIADWLGPSHRKRYYGTHPDPDSSWADTSEGCGPDSRDTIALGPGHWITAADSNKSYDFYLPIEFAQDWVSYADSNMGVAIVGIHDSGVTSNEVLFWGWGAPTKAHRPRLIIRNHDLGTEAITARHSDAGAGEVTGYDGPTTFPTED